MLILVDAMGGDNAPLEIVKGCMDAVNEKDGFDVMLIGDSGVINSILRDNNFNNPRLKIHHTSEVVLNEDSPTKAIKRKKDSSMVVGLNLLKEKKGDAFISAGNTGALMAGALLIVGRIDGVDRPALAPMMPTKTGRTMIIDAGMNTMCRPINYLQFATIGSIYMKEVFGITNPKVGLVNVGTEDVKGNDTVKQAFSLLSSADINFIGNIEGKNVPEGKIDVAVCDGYVGNVLLKTAEGVANLIFKEIKELFLKNTKNKLAASVLKKDFKGFVKRFDPEEYGGTPVLGVEGIVYKCHGSSKARAIRSAILDSCEFTKTTVLKQIRDKFENMEVEEYGYDK